MPDQPEPNKSKKDLYSLLHEVSVSMGRGPYQGLAVRPGQNKVLKLLNRAPEGTLMQQELLHELGIRAPSLSELLAKLERDAYVTRERRGGGTQVAVTITEKGRVSALERELAAQERDEALFGCLDDRDRQDLRRVLQKLLATWRQADGETEGARRERRWAENAQLQAEQREVNALLARVGHEGTEDS